MAAGLRSCFHWCVTRRWTFLLAFWTLYAPFATAAGYTWLFVDCHHCKVTWLKLIWGAPGFVLIVFVRQLVPGGGMELSLVWGVILGAALSLALAALAGG